MFRLWRASQCTCSYLLPKLIARVCIQNVKAALYILLDESASCQLTAHSLPKTLSFNKNCIAASILWTFTLAMSLYNRYHHAQVYSREHAGPEVQLPR